MKVSDIDPDHYDLVIVDEAHHYPAKRWSQFVDHFGKSKQLFLTSTPQVFASFDDRKLCYCLERQEAEKDGIIREIEFDEISQYSHTTDIYKVRT